MLKKLIFAPLFLISLTYLLYLLTQIFKSYDVIFSLSLDTLILLILISSFILVVSLLFVLFSTTALDWKYIYPVGILASFIPMIFLNQALGLIFLVGLIVGLLLSYTGLENTMKSYLTFQPSSLLGPSIRHLSFLLILVICIVYFLSINKVILEKGFQIPDSLIDSAIKLTSGQQSEQIGNVVPQISNDVIKQTVKDQIQTFIKPYLSFVPLILAVLLFLTLQSLISILNLFIYPLLWIIFYILEKSGFIKFTTEMRAVKKMII